MSGVYKNGPRVLISDEMAKDMRAWEEAREHARRLLMADFARWAARNDATKETDDA